MRLVFAGRSLVPAIMHANKGYSADRKERSWNERDSGLRHINLDLRQDKEHAGFCRVL